MNKTFLLGELFCGPGGMALGAKLSTPQKSAGSETYSISHVWGVDKDPNAVETYNANGLGEGVECDAIAFIDMGKTCKHKTIANFQKITALAFGFPCNDFSSVGIKKGFQGKFGNLYKAGVKAINSADPKWFVAENVSGIHSANSGKAFTKILSELEGAGNYGYNLTINLYKFEDYGVAQSRHRYIIVGIRKDQNVKFEVPAPTHINAHISVEEKLSEPYKLPVLNNERTIQSSRVADRLLFTPPWKNAWFLDKLLDMTPSSRRIALSESSWYIAKIAPLSDEEIVNRIKACKLNCTKARMSHIYRRLHTESWRR